MNKVALAVALLPTLLACGGPDARSTTPIGAMTFERTSLRTTLGSEDPNVVGVAIAPDTGATYVLDANRGIIRLSDGGATVVADLDALLAPGALPKSAFTDLAAIGDNRFALTALSDGFLYDANTDTFTSYFCYEPGFIPGEPDPLPEEFTQLTNALTYDSGTDKLYAQPQSFSTPDMFEPFRADIGTFDIEGGEGYGWVPIADAGFSAGGMAVAPDGRMVLGAGAILHWVDMTDGTFTKTLDLSSHGVEVIEALTFDGTDLLIVDGSKDELVRIKF